jgi:hypothetical protein
MCPPAASESGSTRFTPQRPKLALLKNRKWQLLESFVFKTSDGDIVGAPRGFVSDLASVPRLLWFLFPPSGNYAPAAIIHDWLYAAQTVSRARADWIFLDAMRAEGVNWFARWALYFGVRAGGWFPWYKKR